MRTSVTRHAAEAAVPDSRNSSAEAKIHGVNPADDNRLSIDSRTLKSSSTAATTGFTLPVIRTRNLQKQFHLKGNRGRRAIICLFRVMTSGHALMDAQFVGHSD